MKIEYRDLKSGMITVEIKSGEELPPRVLKLVDKLEQILEEARERASRGLPLFK